MFDSSKPIQAAIRAFVFSSSFSFLRKSNLVVESDRIISPKVPRRSDFLVSQCWAFLNIRETKTIQFFQRALCIPFSFIPGSPLCPISVLAHHLRINAVGPSDPLFQLDWVLLSQRVLLLCAISPVF